MKHVRFQDLQKEIKDLQGQLGDLNLLLDKMHTGSDLNQIITDTSAQKQKNQQITQTFNEILQIKQQKEADLRKVEEQIQAFESQAESLVS